MASSKQDLQQKPAKPAAAAAPKVKGTAAAGGGGGTAGGAPSSPGGAAAVGKSVKVFWPDDGAWYTGDITGAWGREASEGHGAAAAMPPPASVEASVGGAGARPGCLPLPWHLSSASVPASLRLRADYSAASGKHLVLYDDGDEEWVALGAERYAWVDRRREAARKARAAGAAPAWGRARLVGCVVVVLGW